jgi:pyruvate kinase
MKQLENNLIGVYRALLNNEFRIKQIGATVDPNFRLSAMNLARYITLRSLDMRQVHEDLSELGISALRSCEGYVWSNLTSSLKLVKLLNGEVWKPNDEVEYVGYKKSKRLLKKHTSNLFGIKKRVQATKIMVTLPKEAATDLSLIIELLNAGMTIARINMSYDDRDIWSRMIENVKTGRTALNKPCKIQMDLSGPKIRTGNISLTKNGSKKKKVDFLRLHHGEHLILNADVQNCLPLRKGKRGELISYACVGVSLPSILKDVKVGDRVLFDDGKIESEVLKKRKGEVEVLIKRTPEKGIKLKGGKGINLPDTQLSLPSLTEADLENIPYVLEHADMIGYSFVRRASDVKALYKQLESFGRKGLGVVLKIENKEAFENLPLILLEGMKFPNLGVMIARGDLAVELGAERIAEVQDQIMWICEAAHIPVIWATQVLETLAKTGLATRAEITDAVHSARAECVMLNKGPYIGEAVRTLNRILQKMESQISKKKNVLRALNVAKMNVDRMGVEHPPAIDDRPRSLK